MALEKQAKILSDPQVEAVLFTLNKTKHPTRNRVMFLFSVKAGLRAKEIASVSWGMVTDSSGEVGQFMALENRASKGKSGGRTIPLNPELRAELVKLRSELSDEMKPDAAVIRSYRGGRLSVNSVTVWFHRLYAKLGMTGCSSHSGRRTFITNAARRVTGVGGSLRDVQQLAGHASLLTTQKYIEGSDDAKIKLVAII